MKNTELEIVHANNIASIINNTELPELKQKIEVYNKEAHGFKDLIQASEANADLCIKLEQKRIIKETSDSIGYELRKTSDEMRGVCNNKGMNPDQQFFYAMFGLLSFVFSIMFVVVFYKTLSQ